MLQPEGLWVSGLGRNEGWARGCVCVGELRLRAPVIRNATSVLPGWQILFK